MIAGGGGASNHEERNGHFRPMGMADLIFGYALRPDLYAVVSSFMFLSKQQKVLHSTELQSIGLRHYPFKTLGKGVQWGLDFGVTVNRSADGKWGNHLLSRRFGAAMRLSLLYDFAKNRGGYAPIVGGTLLLSQNEGSGVLGGGLLLGLNFK